jgi:hypothetical protein
MVYGLLALLTKTTSIDKGKIPPPKVTNRKKFTQICHPSEESDTRWSLHLPNALPRKKGNLSENKVNLIVYFEPIMPIMMNAFQLCPATYTCYREQGNFV